MVRSKNTNLELQLDKILKGLKLEDPISLDDVKNMNWNETDHMDLARLFQFLTDTQYPDDTLPTIYFGGILALLKLGKFKKAEKELKKMGKYRASIIKELLKDKHSKPKNLMDDRVTVGGEDEAYYYWQDQGKFWDETQGAKKFLQNTLVN